jgi:hypothetical protein
MDASLSIFCNILLHFGNDVKQSKLKEVAIIQLGYSRGGIQNHLPDDILHQIKLFVFYDIQKLEIQQKIARLIHSKYKFKVARELNYIFIFDDVLDEALESSFLFIVQKLISNDMNKVENLCDELLFSK